MSKSLQLRNILRRLTRPQTGQNLTLPLVLATVSIAIGVIGWSAALYDGTLNSITAVIIRVAKAFALSPDNLSARGNRLTDVATLLAVLTTVTSAAVIALALLGEAIAKFMARYFARDHSIVIGDTPLARRAAHLLETAGSRVLHAVEPAAPRSMAGGPARLRLEIDARNLVGALQVANAQVTFVDLGSDAATLRFGSSLLHQMRSHGANPSRSTSRLKIVSLAVKNRAVADQYSTLLDLTRTTSGTALIDDGSGTGHVVRAAIFDEDLLVARAALKKSHLFDLAHRRGQPCVHGLIIGFGDLGEKILDQIFLTCVADGLAPPKVTVIDRQAEVREQVFRAKRPNVLNQLDITFLSLDVGGTPLDDADLSPVVTQVLARDAASPATAIFLCLPSDTTTIETALLLRRLANRTYQLAAPIFYRWRETASGDAFPVAPGDATNLPFVRMQLDDATIVDELRRAGVRDRLAEAQHLAYQQVAKISDAGRLSWAELPEALRLANIRVADHLPAKLWSIGTPIPLIEQIFDSEWGNTQADDRKKAMQAVISSIHSNKSRLARLEHERWCVERKLNGWVHGADRDNNRRIHPSLVPWEKLVANGSNAEVAKTYEQTTALMEFLARGN